MLREAAFAGSFYPLSKAEVEKQISKFFSTVRGVDALTPVVISPHAGYVYSGQVAAYSFSALKKFDTYIILSPNHTGLGEMISIYPSGEWETPLGNVKVNGEIASAIAEKMGVEQDVIAHIQEHSIEVQLPFLQHHFGEVKIVPITLGTGDAEVLQELGEAIFEVCGSRVGVIASSDFSHQLPLEKAEELDMLALEYIRAGDIEGFAHIVREKMMSICGFPGIVAAMHYCRKVGLQQGKLLKYDTSASETGDEAAVVGYAAVGFLEK